MLIAYLNSYYEIKIMASKISSGDLISERYSSALYELASDKKCIDDILVDFKKIEYVFKESSELKKVIKSPLVNSEEKLNILLKIFSQTNMHQLTTTFLKVLDNNKRIPNLLTTILQFKKINSEKRGDISADITSANELSDEEKNNITNQLKNSLGQKLSLNFDVDKTIIGGLIVKVGSKMIDTSIANKINKLRIAMKGA